MTNGEKFKTAKEREEAFMQFCDEGYMKQDCINCPLVKGSSCDYSCTFDWLDLEAEDEKPLPCPFCGGRCSTNGRGRVYQVACKGTCGYVSTIAETESEAIAAHNRVAKKCREVKS